MSAFALVGAAIITIAGLSFAGLAIGQYARRQL